MIGSRGLLGNECASLGQQTTTGAAGEPTPLRVVAHEGVRARMMDTNMADHVARVGAFGPEEPALLEGYTPNMPVITFKNGMTTHVGDHTFEMIHMPGHTLYQAAILIKEEAEASSMPKTSLRWWCRLSSSVNTVRPTPCLLARVFRCLARTCTS